MQDHAHVESHQMDRAKDAVDMLKELKTIEREHRFIFSGATDVNMARPAKLLQALQFLHEHHPFYQKDAQVAEALRHMEGLLCKQEEGAKLEARPPDDLVAAEFSYFTHGGPAPIGEDIAE
mmetsp:Transcript_9909/g.22527  ORF Transcript_9909/g.22527 Transcript_9909/m.22527 type:complete len:121 (+) Transcript_9909:56-418(+)